MPSLATMISSSSRCETLRYSRTGNWMFCRTVSEENSAPCWNRMPQRRSTARRSALLAASRSTPNTSIRPETFGHQPNDGARQHRFAGTRRTDKPQNLAALDVQIESVEHARLAELNRDVADPDDGIGWLNGHGHIPIDAKKIANTPSITMTKKIPFTTEAVVCWPSNSALPCTASPSTQATMPITAAITGALMMPTMK